MDLKEIVKKFSENIASNSADAMVLGSSASLEITALYIVSKSLLGTAFELRKDRVREFFHFTNKHLDKFTREVLEDEQIQDGFVYILQQYITERNKYKRDAILAILLGFVGSNDRENFELEKLNSVLKLVSVEDIEIIKVWVDGTIEQWLKMQFGSQDIEKQKTLPLNIAQYGELILCEMKGMSRFKNKEYAFEKFNYLVGIGLLTEDAGTTWDGNGSFKISIFGKEFIKYIMKN